MKHFGMTKERSFDSLTDAEDLKALVERALEKVEGVAPEAFFCSGSKSFRDFCQEQEKKWS